MENDSLLKRKKKKSRWYDAYREKWIHVGYCYAVLALCDFELVAPGYFIPRLKVGINLEREKWQRRRDGDRPRVRVNTGLLFMFFFYLFPFFFLEFFLVSCNTLTYYKKFCAFFVIKFGKKYIFIWPWLLDFALIILRGIVSLDKLQQVWYLNHFVASYMTLVIIFYK